jgi:hypothetical protein
VLDVPVFQTLWQAAGHFLPPLLGDWIIDGQVPEPVEHFCVEPRHLGLAAQQAEQRLEWPGNAELTICLEPGPFLLPVGVPAVQEAQCPSNWPAMSCISRPAEAYMPVRSMIRGTS